MIDGLDRYFIERVILALKGQLPERDKNIIIEQLQLIVDCDIDKIKSKNGHILPSLNFKYKKNVEEILNIGNDIANRYQL